MIYGRVEDIAQYAAIHPEIKTVVEAAQNYSGTRFSPGRVELDGERVYMNLSSYQTHSSEGALAEAHRAYVDVMVMLEGTETVYVQHTSQMKIVHPYDPQIEAALGKLSETPTAVVLKPGDFLILFPQDAHMPACHAAEESAVKKAIGKIRI